GEGGWGGGGGRGAGGGRAAGARRSLPAVARSASEPARRGRLLRHRRAPYRRDLHGVAGLAGPAAPNGRRLLPERRVRQRLQRLVQRRELACNAQELLTRVEVSIERVHLVTQPVEAREQRVELTIADVFSFHGCSV